MWATVVLACVLVHLATSAPSGTSQSCLASEYTTCNRYQQCCGNRCQGQYETSCSEENGRVKTASCQCKQAGVPVHTRANVPASNTHNTGGHRDTGSRTGGTGGHSGSDANGMCRTRVGTTGSCDAFKQCCRNHCAQGYSHFQCSATNNRITQSACTCA